MIKIITKKLYRNFGYTTVISFFCQAFSTSDAFYVVLLVLERGYLFLGTDFFLFNFFFVIFAVALPVATLQNLRGFGLEPKELLESS